MTARYRDTTMVTMLLMLLLIMFIIMIMAVIMMAMVKVSPDTEICLDIAVAVVILRWQ